MNNNKIKSRLLIEMVNHIKNMRMNMTLQDMPAGTRVPMIEHQMVKC